MLTADLIVAANAEPHWMSQLGLLVICVLMCGYLLAALLWPEKF